MWEWCRIAITSTFPIPLPFEVLNEITMVKRFGGKNGSIILYVDLEAVVRDNYANTDTTNDFNVID